MSYELVVVTAREDWERYHLIRRTELFEARHRNVVYDPDHPDEVKPNHTPLLLKFGGNGVGTTRLDLLGGGRAAIRLVAVTRAEQGKGHGRVLHDKVEAFARAMGVAQLVVNAAPEALGYYRRMGFVPEEWDAAELAGIAKDCIQMTKLLR